jgi:regulator of sirC expression with transglutaminase-like and TPR domain
MDTKIRRKFSEIAALPDEEIHLDEAALLIAAETEENIDISLYLQALDELSLKFQRGLEKSSGLGISVNGLIDFIHVSEGFGGNAKNYYDPENSYLNRVIDTRQGVPISLALIHIALGGRLNIPVRGINFPGHFLIQYGSDKHVIVDPFSGRILSKPDCSTLLRQIAGPKAVLQDEYFETASNKDILIRILDNLKQIFWRKKSWGESKACIDRQLLLLPERAEFNIQLGAVHEMQGNVTLARNVYMGLIQHSENEKLRSVASQRLLALESKPVIIH